MLLSNHSESQIRGDQPMVRTKTQSRQKIQFYMNPEDVKTYKELKKKLHITTLSDLIRTALFVFYSICGLLNNGGELLVRLPDGKEKIIIIPGLWE